VKITVVLINEVLQNISDVWRNAVLLAISTTLLIPAFGL
jgi:hypothetical protein